jgi:hypothetical protein
MFLHNHLRFTILYNRDAATDLSRIVGFEVEAFSVKHGHEGKVGRWGARACVRACVRGRPSCQHALSLPGELNRCSVSQDSSVETHQPTLPPPPRPLPPCPPVTITPPPHHARAGTPRRHR